MFKKKHNVQEADATKTDDSSSRDPFRAEAEEHAERAERARLEHRAAELGVTVGQLQEGILPVVEDVPVNDEHVRESLRESEKATHVTHTRHR